MKAFAAWICLLSLCLAVLPRVAAAEGLSREQGDAILEELRKIRVLLEQGPRRPGPPLPAPALQPSVPQEKVTLTLHGDYSLGRADAPVVIVEYTDYQCAFCERFRAETFPEIRKNLIDTGKARFVKRDLPLPAHPGAMKAAEAARCAGDQGKFWEMHDRLSAHFSSLGPDAYARFARELSLDVQEFRSCLDSDRHMADIQASARGAGAIGIGATPSFVVGTISGNVLEGVRITGAQPYGVFEKAITDLLAARPGERAAGSCPKQ